MMICVRGMGREDEVAESVVEDVDIVFEKRSKRKKGRQWSVRL